MTTEAGELAGLDGGAGAAARLRRLFARLRVSPTGWAAERTAMRAEAQAQVQNWFLWAPIAFGCGCGLYLGLAFEPPLWPLVGLAAAACAIAVLVRRFAGCARSLGVLATLLAFFVCGVAMARLRAAEVAAPVIPYHMTKWVDGWVVDVASPGATGNRLVIAPFAIGGMRPEQLPRRIRVTIKGGAPYGPGAAVRFKAILNPSPAPASPGAYDFARDSWFAGIGGVGFALSDPMMVEGPPPRGLLAVQLQINAARWALAQRMATKLGPGSAGLGVAMVTGHEAWMSNNDETALRNSGLAHIISISGVHMALVGGFVFFVARLLIAAWPWLTLRVPGKKVAAASALTAIAVYLVISGAPPPAVRSAVTLSVAFIAILLDRQAITMHSLAVAALAVLILQPEAVAQPGFEMSFAATAALVALARIWPHPPRELNAPWPVRLYQKAVWWFAAAVAASLVAGLATSPFAIQNFNRVAVFGLPANLASEPLEGFVIMPALALGAVCEAANLPDVFLPVAAWGIGALNVLAVWFAGLPHAVFNAPSGPDWTLPVAFIGLLWMCLWRGRLRWLGLPAALAVSIAPRPPTPAAWIAADGGAAAVADGAQAILLRPEAKAFAVGLWSRRRGLRLPPDPSAARDTRFDCNRLRCFARSGAAPSPSPRISAWWTRRRPDEEDLDALCRSGDVVILRAAVAAPPSCAGKLVLGLDDFHRGGAAELYAAGGRWRVAWAQPLRGVRPWTIGDADE